MAGFALGWYKVSFTNHSHREVYLTQLNTGLQTHAQTTHSFRPSFLVQCCDGQNEDKFNFTSVHIIHLLKDGISNVTAREHIQGM